MGEQGKDYTIVLLGNPNVGKSVIFYGLTGRYATVSNYPGTTVDVSTGRMQVGEHHRINVIDTPGLYNLRSITEEERVSKRILMEERPDAVIHVVDAKNIERMLPLTLQLIEAGLPVILVLNMFDELQRRGLEIQISHLEHDLGIPVVATVATKHEGIDNLKSRIISVVEGRYSFQPMSFSYSDDVEKRIDEVASIMPANTPLSARSMALLAIAGDEDAVDMAGSTESVARLREVVDREEYGDVSLSIARERHAAVHRMIKEHFQQSRKPKKERMANFFDSITMHPIAGVIMVGLILYFGFYKFVAQFGAGTLVDFIEAGIFEAHINPWVNQFFEGILGGTIFFNLFAGEYGIVTLGIRYAIAIVLPVVFTFFLLFSVMEDSGYLTRLSMILDRMFKGIGLSGRSVIPVVLGVGCGTMATVVTRTLETARERYMVTFLLALAVPCSAQLGVILGLLSGSFASLMIWFTVIVMVFLIAGLVLNRYTKGKPATFFMEIPPLRLPKAGNVMIKTYSRMKWYAIEVIPIFIYASILIWVGKITRIFDVLVHVLSYPARAAGLPNEMGEIFLYGFFRRDFGAAGLFDMRDTLDLRQMLVATVILTLFVPCIAQFAVMIKERGPRTAIFIFATVVPFAFLTGIVLNAILGLVGMP